MEDYLLAAALGLVQALTEFLPISSSGHLAVAGEVVGGEVRGLTFDVGLHLGTTAAVLAYFRRDWALIAASAWRDARAHRGAVRRWRWRSRLGLLLALGSLPAAAAGAALELAADGGPRSPPVVGAALIAGGALMWAIDARARAGGGLRAVDAPRALAVGAAQAVALVPGVSRSAATISAGRALGLDRTAAARFSFLLSAPVTLGAGAVLVREAARRPDEVAWGPMLLGAAVAALAGLLAIGWLLRFLRRRGLRVFAWYRIALGAAVLAAVQAGAL